MLFIVKKDRSVESILGSLNIGDTATDIVVVAPFTGIQTCEIKYTLPNGQEGKPAFATFYSGKEFESGSAYVMRIPKEMNTIAGEVQAQIILTDTTAKQFASNPFTFPVDGITALPIPDSEEQGSDFAAILKAIAASYTALFDEVHNTVADEVEEGLKYFKAEANESIKEVEASIAKTETAKASLEGTISEATEKENNLGEYIDYFNNFYAEAASYFEEKKEQADEMAADAAGSIVSTRFAGKLQEDSNMNLRGGDSVDNTGGNGDDMIADNAKCNTILSSGGGNNISGNHNLISGALNTVDAENCLVNGIWNEARLVTKMVNGVEHTYGHRAALLGRGLISNANDQVWVGRWNVPNEGVLFGVGAGTSISDRFSAFRVYPKGTATVGHDPIGDMDVVTKHLLDDANAAILAGEVANIQLRNYAKSLIDINAAGISRNDKRITNLELGISPDPFVVDNSVAYSKVIPDNVLPYAEITQIGGLTRTSHNLVPYPYNGLIMNDGSVFTIQEDRSVTIKGVSTTKNVYYLARDMTISSGTYTLSLQILFGTKTSKARLETAVTTSEGIRYYHCKGGTDAGFKTFSVTENGTLNLYLVADVSDEDVNLTVRPMLNKGDVALPYEEYYEGYRSAKVTAVESHCANLIPFPYASSGLVKNGITFAVQEDGGVRVSGTSTASVSFQVAAALDLEPGTYAVSGGVGNIIVTARKKDSSGADLGWIDSGNTRPFSGTLDNGESLSYVAIYVSQGVTVNGIIYPVLSRGAVARAYTPYRSPKTFSLANYQTLASFGDGNPQNAEEYNYIDFDSKKYIKQGFLSNGVWIDGTDSEEDISARIKEDNMIEVEAGGLLVFVNENGLEVPSTVTYMIKEDV